LGGNFYYRYTFIYKPASINLQTYLMHKLEADSITLHFGLKKILSNVYVTCQTGHITGLLGKNGSGKSCLLNVIYGTLQATGKSIRFNNTVVSSPYKNPRLLLYLPQFNFIPKGLTLKQIFSHYTINFAEFENHFPELGIKYNTGIKQLSGGYTRLVELYILLKSNTRFVILDEPFTHIMPLHIEKIKQILLQEKQNKGIIVTDHMYKHITDIADNIYVLSNGKTHLTNNLTDIEKLGYARL